MKKITYIFAFLPLITFAQYGGIKITKLPPADSIKLSALIPMSQDGRTQTVSAGQLVGAICDSCYNSHWAANSNKIYNTNSGNVGIGTNSAGFKLDIRGSFAVIDSSDNSYLAAGNLVGKVTGGSSSCIFGYADTTILATHLQIKDGTAQSGYVFTSDASGNASWQSPTTQCPLTCNSWNGTSGNWYINRSGQSVNSNTEFDLVSGSPLAALDSIGFSLLDAINGDGIFYSSIGSGSFPTMKLGFEYSFHNVVEIDTDKTIFNRPIQIQDGTQANGYVLTSDASGNATWAKITANNKFDFSGLPQYANNAAALSGGLTVGQIYIDNSWHITVVH